MIGQPLGRLMPVEYRRQHDKDVASYFATGEPSGAINNLVELPGLHRSGERFEMELSLAAGELGDDKIVLAVLRNVTERKRAEAALRDAELRYRQIFESTSEAMVLIDSDNDAVVDANQSAEQLLGQPLSGLQGQRLGRFISKSEPEPKPRKGGDSAHAELKVITTWDGRRVPVEADSVEMNLGGDRTMNLHIFRDVSDRVELRRRLLDVQEDERRRISRDLHDGVTQLLVGVGLQIDHFGRRFAQQEPLASELSKVRGLIGEATRETREICMRLRPDTLDDFGLIPSIRSHVSALAPIGPRVEITVPPDFGRLPADVESALYRIAQEALANTLRHASAEEVDITFEQDGRNVTMIVCDDGEGFDAEDVLSSGRKQASIGLAGMAERVQLLGGRLAVDSAPGKGTTVRVDLQVELQPDSPEPDKS
jgi:PAS domain S-box-containing protein